MSLKSPSLISPYYQCSVVDRLSRHIQAFAKALQAEDIADDPSESNLLSPTTSAPPSPRVRKVSALSDFAPVNQRVRKCVELVGT